MTAAASILPSGFALKASRSPGIHVLPAHHTREHHVLVLNSPPAGAPSFTTRIQDRLSLTKFPIFSCTKYDNATWRSLVLDILRTRSAPGEADETRRAGSHGEWGQAIAIPKLSVATSPNCLPCRLIPNISTVPPRNYLATAKRPRVRPLASIYHQNDTRHLIPFLLLRPYTYIKGLLYTLGAQHCNILPTWLVSVSDFNDGLERLVRRTVSLSCLDYSSSNWASAARDGVKATHEGCKSFYAQARHELSLSLSQSVQTLRVACHRYWSTMACSYIVGPS